MSTLLDRMREMAGIVESRPAYQFLVKEEIRIQSEAHTHVSSLTEAALEAEVEATAALCDRLERGETDEDGPVFNPNIAPKDHYSAANLQHKMARKHKLLRRKDKSTPRDHTDVDNSTHGSIPHAGAREQRNHAAAAFHHKHAARLYGDLGMTHKATRHGALAMAHQARAGSHRVDLDKATGKHRVTSIDLRSSDHAPLHPEKKKQAKIKRPLSKLPVREPDADKAKVA